MSVAEGCPEVPEGLGAAGTALWCGLTDVYVFAPREVAVLTLACRQADDVAALEAALAEDGPVVVGSRGQPRLSAVVTELRQGRVALARLLGDLALPGEDDQVPRTAASERASRAAQVRWSRQRARDAS